MKKRRKRQLVILLIFLVIALLISGYVKFFNGKGLYFTKGMNKNELMKLEDNTTYTFEAKILISDSKKEYEEMFGSDIWNEKIGDATFEEYILDQIKAKLMRVRAMNVLAKERGVVLGREEKDAVKDAVDNYLKTLSTTEIEEMGITRDKLIEMFTDFAIANKLYEDLTSLMDIEVSSDEARVIDIQYIASDSKEEIEKAYGLVSSGSSFFAVAKEYNSDGQYEYELKRGEMVEAFEDAAYELQTGQMSGIVEADGKYYIIRCTSDNDKAKTEVNKAAILESRKLEQFNKEFEYFESKLFIEFNDKEWEKIRITDCRKLEGSFDEYINTCL